MYRINWNDPETIPQFLLKFRSKQIENRIKTIDYEIVEIVVAIHELKNSTKYIP